SAQIFEIDAQIAVHGQSAQGQLVRIGNIELNSRFAVGACQRGFAFDSILKTDFCRRGAQISSQNLAHLSAASDESTPMLLEQVSCRARLLVNGQDRPQAVNCRFGEIEPETPDV